VVGFRANFFSFQYQLVITLPTHLHYGTAMTDGKRLSREEALKVAKLACLSISGEEADKVTEKINAILGYVDRLQSVDVSQVEPMSHVHGSTNVFREDELRPSLPVQELLSITPSSSGRFIKVPIVIDEG
jgi:aspartyl-tRNA(Asn)/glutamyl-tRNA(Gln) amidotransferase subunit C